jgi:quercetin dioxygenase-like cupin family protein
VSASPALGGNPFRWATVVASFQEFVFVATGDRARRDRDTMRILGYPAEGGAMQNRIPGRKLFVAVTVAVTVAVSLGTLGVRALYAQAPGFKRVELQRHDTSSPGHEAVLARGEFNPGAAVPKHTHPGEEVGYILEGQIALEVEGKPAVTLKAGDTFFVPAGQVHAAKNAGTTPAKVLSTYIVEKGKPLATPVPVPVK